MPADGRSDLTRRLKESRNICGIGHRALSPITGVLARENRSSVFEVRGF